MKKKLLAIIFSVFYVFILTSCNPNNVANETYSLGKEALNVMTDYINADISKTKAEEKLERIHDELDSLEFGDNPDGIAASADISIIQSEITRFELSLSLDHSTSDLQEIIDDLEESIM